MDEDLRTLERNTRDAPSRLRYARALERAGRGDEALSILQGSIDDPDVRSELARFPAAGIAGEFDAHFVDVAPIRKEPRLRWRRRLDAIGLAAAPLGVVVVGDHRVSVRDPRTGKLRFSRPARSAVVHGDRLFVSTHDEIDEHDLWTGERLARRPARSLRLAPSGPGVLVLVPSGTFGVPGEVVRSHALDEVLPSSPALWADEEVVLAKDRRDAIVRETTSGRELARLEGALSNGCLVDGAGFLTRYAGRLRLLDRTGHTLWSREANPVELVALARDAVIVRDEGWLFAHDRATGTRTSKLLVSSNATEVEVVRDVAYVRVPGEGVHAVTLGGERLWHLDAELVGMRPQPRGLFAILGREVVAFEEP